MHPLPNAASGGLHGKLKVKPNLGCRSNLAMTISYISIVVSYQSDDPKIDGVMALQVPRSHSKPVTLNFDLRSRKSFIY